MSYPLARLRAPSTTRSPGTPDQAGRVRVPRVMAGLAALGCLGGVVVGAAPAARAAVPDRADVAASILKHLNHERAHHGLPALHSRKRLVRSAHRHNKAMAAADELSHQVSGERALGDRISSCDYDWSSAGENIAVTSELTTAGAVVMQKLMYHEKAPDNGHRLNILSRTFTNVGIDVVIDATHHRLWITEDFGRPM